MATQILFIQGGGAGAHDRWDNRLVDSLRRELGPGYDVHYPRMPDEADPSYARWKPALTKLIAGLPDNAILMGHSIGATVLINALAAGMPHNKIAGVFLLAAPFVGAGGWPSDEIEPMADLGRRLPPETPVHLFHGDRDETAPISHIDLYAAAIPVAVVHRLADHDHQLNDDVKAVAAQVLALA